MGVGQSVPEEKNNAELGSVGGKTTEISSTLGDSGTVTNYATGSNKYANDDGTVTNYATNSNKYANDDGTVTNYATDSNKYANDNIANGLSCNNSDDTLVGGTTDNDTNILTSITCKTPNGIEYAVTKKTVDIKCPADSTYESTSDDGISTCVGIVKTITAIRCPVGYSYTNTTADGVITCTLQQNQQNQAFTSHVYEFKSRKGHNVESFSQNTNGKCKARY